MLAGRGEEVGIELARGLEILLRNGVKVHVLDEPFAGINPVVKDTLIELILQENRSGATFLIG